MYSPVPVLRPRFIFSPVLYIWLNSYHAVSELYPLSLRSARSELGGDAGGDPPRPGVPPH